MVFHGFFPASRINSYSCAWENRGIVQVPPFSRDHAALALSHREEAAEKRPVAAQGKTEVLC